MKKYIGKIIYAALLIAVFFAGQFGFIDIVRKNLFPNDRDKIEKQFYEVIERAGSEDVVRFSWNHPGNGKDSSDGKEKVAFMAGFHYQGNGFNAFVLDHVKPFLHEIQTQKLLLDKYDAIAFWIFHYTPDNRVVHNLSFYIDSDTLYNTDWLNISDDELWVKAGIE